ncbi:hypothetical protein SLEP1_g14950 [Rubroshorea leprosula]|uniref:Uncharacterized protein n=1 Tax=Rubroshorea leprosula TaxID=152421 RepID=A0AAV5IUT9_9ROSI|nr:hypothetical protein SLEP1_g14950 [Rubroshorea leprosula]
MITDACQWEFVKHWYFCNPANGVKHWLLLMPASGSVLNTGTIPDACQWEFVKHWYFCNPANGVKHWLLLTSASGSVLNTVLLKGYPYLLTELSHSFPCPPFQEAKPRTGKTKGSDELEG